MDNPALLASMLDRYTAHAFAHQYIFGYADRKNIYVSFADETILPFVCTLDTASRGAGCSLRFKPTKAQKELLKVKKTFILCSEKYFNECVDASKYNAGEVFEKMMTEYYGQKWEKDKRPFTEAGDVEVDGIAYQIKYNRATFANEAGLARLG